MKRNLSIDLVKVIAMFMVLALHIVIFKGKIPLSIFRSWNSGLATIAIPLFFMVSGYLLSRKPFDYHYSFKKIKSIIIFIFKTTTLFVVIESLFFSDGQILQLIRSYYAWIMQRGIMWQYWYFAAMIIIYALLPFLGKIINSKYHLPVIICLVAISFIFFLLNIFYDFERLYIRQTFRIWYWFMYFLVGAYIRNHQEMFNWITWKHVIYAIIFMLVYVYYVEIPYDEYSFGSIICMIYAVIVFSACLNTKIIKGRVIQELSSLFLPVYAIHPFVINKLSFLDPYFDFSPSVKFFVVLALIICVNVPLAYLLMKIPYVKEIFKM